MIINASSTGAKVLGLYRKPSGGTSFGEYTKYERRGIFDRALVLNALRVLGRFIRWFGDFVGVDLPVSANVYLPHTTQAPMSYSTVSFGYQLMGSPPDG
jgi:hypothetical protein